MPQRYQVTSDGLNVHEAPGAHGKVFDQIAKGDVVVGYDERMLGDYRWVRVRGNMFTGAGWVDARFIEPVMPSPKPRPTPQPDPLPPLTHLPWLALAVIVSGVAILAALYFYN